MQKEKRRCDKSTELSRVYMGEIKQVTENHDFSSRSATKASQVFFSITPSSRCKSIQGGKGEHLHEHNPSVSVTITYLAPSLVKN